MCRSECYLCLSIRANRCFCRPIQAFSDHGPVLCLMNLLTEFHHRSALALHWAPFMLSFFTFATLTVRTLKRCFPLVATPVFRPLLIMSPLHGISFRYSSLIILRRIILPLVGVRPRSDPLFLILLAYHATVTTAPINSFLTALEICPYNHFLLLWLHD